MTAFMSTLQAVQGTAPDPPCGEFDIEAVAEDGTRRKVPLASATRIPFADMTPVRRIKARRGAPAGPDPLRRRSRGCRTPRATTVPAGAGVDVSRQARRPGQGYPGPALPCCLEVASGYRAHKTPVGQ